MTKYSGLSRDPAYTHITLDDLPGAKEYLEGRAADMDYPTKTYVGSCHCQAVKFAVQSKPLEETLICDCGCSICRGVGWSLPGEVPR